MFSIPPRTNKAKSRTRQIVVAAAILTAGAAVVLFALASTRSRPEAPVASAPGTAAPTEDSSDQSPVQLGAAVEPRLALPQQSVAPGPPQTASLAGTKGEAIVEGKTRALTGTDGLFDRVFIPINTPIRISLNLENLEPGSEVLISAPNGGNLQRAGGPLQFKASATTQPLVLDFEPVLGRGAYTIRIQHKGASQIIDLWAGPPNPLGQPGPAYVAQPFTEVDNNTPPP